MLNVFNTDVAVMSPIEAPESRNEPSVQVSGRGISTTNSAVVSQPAARPKENITSAVTTTLTKPSTKVVQQQQQQPSESVVTREHFSIPPRLRNARKYNAKDVSFVSISDIPSDLLASVAVCFKDMQLVCRICFFESNCTLLIKKKDRSCGKDHVPWKPIKVIPRSALCSSPLEFIPLPPLPKHMQQYSIPFVVCKKTDHRTCYAMSKGTNPWFPHTVEELVVWTVERECGE